LIEILRSGVDQNSILVNQQKEIITYNSIGLVETRLSRSDVKKEKDDYEMIFKYSYSTH